MLFLINLDCAAERRARMVRQLSALELAYQRVGFDGRERSAADIAHWVHQNFPGITFAPGRLSGAEIGCWLSHMTAWRAMLDEPGVESCTVIEDDVVLDPRFGVARARLEARGEFDVVFLGTSSRNLSPRNHRQLDDGLQLHRPIGSVFNTWGYVITRRYCERLFARLQRVVWPIDHVLGGRVQAFKARRAVVQPPMVSEDPELGIQSQIEPYTFRLDRSRLVESARRSLLGSRVGDLYYRLHRFF
jgi:glycosyl transferase, family 25